MKTILILGGLRALKAPILEAQGLGYRVVTADWLPGNPAHRWSDGYINASITDTEAVVDAALSCEADGILCYAVDPGVVPAAQASNRLGLPAACPDESAAILQNKYRFRRFLSEHGFAVPKVVDVSNCRDEVQAAEATEGMRYPLVVKPSDSAGSKGVALANTARELPGLVSKATEYSRCGIIIAEEYVETDYPHSDSDWFVENGEIVFPTFSAAYNDPLSPNPFVPYVDVWPSQLPEEIQEKAVSEVGRLVKLLGLRTTVMNVEMRVGRDGEIYLIEVTPRAGGPRLSEMVRYATGEDLVGAALKSCIGEAAGITGPVEYEGYWMLVQLHSRHSGVYKGLRLDLPEGVEIIDKDIWIEPGDKVEAFTGANSILGTLVLRFPTSGEMEAGIRNLLGEHPFVGVEVS